MLKVDIQSAPPVATLVCSGRIVLGVEAETLRCMATSRSERHLLLELSRISRIDAAGLGVLVELHRWAQQRSATLTIANPSPPAHKLIALTGLDRVLHLCGTDGAADCGSLEWQSMTA